MAWAASFTWRLFFLSVWTWHEHLLTMFSLIAMLSHKVLEKYS